MTDHVPTKPSRERSTHRAWTILAYASLVLAFLWIPDVLWTLVTGDIFDALFGLVSPRMFVYSLLAVVLGHLAHRRAASHTARIFAVIGFVCGYLGLLVRVLFFVGLAGMCWGADCV